jgi:hypothetical protein
VLPVFDSPLAEQLLPVAERVKAVLTARGVEVEIRERPEIGAYWLSYDPSEKQKQENARIDAGQRIGKIQRQTLNGNDWYSALAGYRFGRPVILIDLVGRKAVQGKPVPGKPMADALGSAGILWPEVSETFPGSGRAVVQGVPWAFAPRTTAILLQAADMPGLIAAAESLSNLPEDLLTPTIRAARNRLWRQYHVGGEPDRPSPAGLTSLGYSDRNPMWQAQWEDILQLCERLVRRERRPMEFEVQLDGRSAGKLLSTRTETAEVQLEMASPSADLRPRTAREEVVTRLEGEVELPAERHELLIIPRHVVDGRLSGVGVGMEPELPKK